MAPRVVDVVTDLIRPRAVLAPARHARVDQPPVALQAGVGAQTEPLGDAWPEALDQDVGLLQEPEDELRRSGVLEVGWQGRAALGQQVRSGHAHHRTVGAVDADDVGAELGQQHAGIGRRPDTGQLDDADARQRTLEARHARDVSGGPRR
jgi:hypothetical protein